MGLFRNDVPLDEAFAKVVHTGEGRARKVLAKGQEEIRRALRPGETALAIAVDELAYDVTVVVTAGRVLVMGRGGRDLVRAVAVAEVPGAFAEPARGGATFELDRMGVRLHVGESVANMLTQLVNGLVLSSRPRAIPTLHPAFYTELLTRAGVPDTPTNRLRLAERTAFTIGTQAGAFTAQLEDPEAFAEFMAHFATTAADRQLQQADDMVDWLWAWHPLCHQGLTRQVTKWHDGLLSPPSFLTAAAGGEIPPWSEASDGNNARAWQMVHDRNRRQ